MGLRKKTGAVRSKRAVALSINSPPAFDPLRFVEPTAAAKSRVEMIAELAYFRAQGRSFEPGHDIEDWLAAEAEIEHRHEAQNLR
jgi:hypothetical protein